MNNPKIHHYIPQSYLRNFSWQKKGQHYVYVRFRGEKFHPTNIKNICSENNFYSIPGDSDNNRFIIENFYADNIDSLFPRITDLITDDGVQQIQKDTRRELLTAIISLYFRTPKFLNRLSDSLKRLREEYPLQPIFNLDLYGKNIEVRLDNGMRDDEIMALSKEIFLQEHMRIISQFTEFKANDGIAVKKIIDESEYITSDNPVLIRKGNEYLYDIFDPKNSIYIPITPKYLLIVFPNNELSIKGKFDRIQGQLMDVLTINIDIEKNSQDWIIGSQESLDNHLADQVKYNEESPENYKIVKDLEDKAMLINDFYTLLERNGGTITPEVLLEIRRLSKHPLAMDDPNWETDIRLLRDKGYDV